MRKAREHWSQLSRILGREVENPRVLGILFKAVVQALLLFGSETWVMTPRMGRAMGRVQHRLAIWITDSQPQRLMVGSWD